MCLYSSKILPKRNAQLNFTTSTTCRDESEILPKRNAQLNVTTSTTCRDESEKSELDFSSSARYGVPAYCYVSDFWCTVYEGA